jgi:hypothetical protein
MAICPAVAFVASIIIHAVSAPVGNASLYSITLARVNRVAS